MKKRKFGGAFKTDLNDDLHKSQKQLGQDVIKKHLLLYDMQQLSLNDSCKVSLNLNKEKIGDGVTSSDKEWLKVNNNPFFQPKKKSNLKNKNNSILYHQQLALETAEDKQKRREKNRIAAAKTRERKAEKYQNLQAQKSLLDE